jgi:hypothetical protein
MWNVWWDTTQLTWAHHFANPFWVNPRNLFPQQGHQLDSRYLRFWDVLTQIYNQSCDDGMYRQSFYNLGRTDETLMWPHRIEHLSPGWVVFNLPQGWETHWNQRLIQDWTNNANFLLEKHRDKLDSSVWVNELWLRFTHTVYRCCFSEQALWKILRLGFFIVGATSFFRPLLFSYRTAIQTLETGVTVKQEGISREIPSCFLENKNPRAATYQIGAPFPGMSMLSYQRLHNKLFVHSDTPNSEKYEFGQVRSPSWRWNPYDYHFTTYRRHPLWSRFSTGQRYRRGFLQAAESGFFPMGKKPDSALLDQNFSDLPPVKDYYRVSSPVLPLVGRVWFSAQAVPRQELRCDTSANKLKWSQPALAKSTSLWLVAQPTRIFEVSEPGGIDFPEWRGQSIRASRRRKRRENRPITSYNVRPQQYRKIHRRYVDDSVRQNPRHSPSEELFSFVKTGVTTPLLQLRNQRTINQRRWWEIPKVTSIGVTPVKLNPVEQLFLDQLVEVNYPGRCKGKLHRRATPASTGTNWGLYHEDYNNEPFYGHQGDDETVELEDAENPLLSYNNLASVTGVPNASVVWPRTQTSHPTSRNLVSWSRWCGLPLSWYGRPQLGVTQTYQSGWIFERCYWSPIASDHPAAEISSLLVTYDIPRFYRRLTRWFDFVPPKARHALYRDPWGNTSAATSDRVGSGGVVNRPYKAKARRISRILQRHGGGDGGDLSSWPSVGIYLWDELQQTGWGPRTKHHNDNLEATEVGTTGELPHVDHTYRGYLRRGWGYRTSFVSWITHSEGINLDGGSSGGDIQSSDLPLEVDPEQVLLAWWSPPYWVDGYDEEELWLDDYMFERDPEDGFDHPAEEEHNSEVARSEPRDLPGWVVAAAVAGTADPLEALHDGAAEGVELAPGTRVWGSNPNFIRFYYRHWLRHKRQPLWWGSRLSWGGDGVNAKLVHEKLEISGGVGPVDPGIEGNPLWANVDDHIRVWALTEIYLRDRPCGWASPV